MCLQLPLQQLQVLGAAAAAAARRTRSTSQQQQQQQQQQQKITTTTWGERRRRRRRMPATTSPSGGVSFLPHTFMHNCCTTPCLQQDFNNKTSCWVENKAVLKDHRAGRKKIVEDLWREFFSDPSQWWDHRAEKAHARYPDFKHKKKAQQALWLDDRRNPSWVEADLAAMAPGAVQSHIYSWNTKLARCVRAGQPRKAMELFRQMQQEGMIPDTFTFVRVLNACAELRVLEEGRRIHTQIIRHGCESDIHVASSLVNMYAKCGSVEEAWRVFREMTSHDVVSWTAVIFGHVKCGRGREALELFREMQQEGVRPDCVTFVGVLNACASIGALEQGRRVHEQIVHCGCVSDVFVGSSLVDMYAKCGSMEDARRAFDQMPAPRDLICWNAMILGDVRCGRGRKALELVRRMRREGVRPDRITFVGILNACSSLLALEEGTRAHKRIVRSDWESDVFVGSSLVDMYAKCGSVEDAWKAFNVIMPLRNVVSWNAMLGGFAMHGHGKEALAHFECMCQEGVKIDHVTFVCLLSACSHMGLVDEGLHYFDAMRSVYGISATVEHVACTVDLLCRAGRLREAEDFISTMSCEPSSSMWKSLLCSCRVHGELEMGERIAKQALNADPGNSALYALLSNIYAATGKWDLKANVQQLRSERHPNVLELGEKEFSFFK